MINTEQLKENLKERIEMLSEEKLKDVSQYLDSLLIENNKRKLLSFAGSWNDLDDKALNDLTVNLKDKRK